MLVPGIKVNTSPIDHVPIDQMQIHAVQWQELGAFGDLQTGN